MRLHDGEVVNEPATSNKQVIGIVATVLMTVVLGLCQYAILDRLAEQGTEISQLNKDVSSLLTGRTDDLKEIDSHSVEIQELQRTVDHDKESKIDGLNLEVKSAHLALRHDRAHADREAKALTNEIVRKAVIDP